MMRFHQARGMMDQGMNASEAVNKLRPPVFFGERDRFMGELQRWGSRKIEMALDILLEAEIDCKTTGNPADVICARALLRLTKAAK